MKRWWRYAVVRGEGIPVALDGKWFDLGDPQLDDAVPLLPMSWEGSVEVTPTNRWEQRDDGAVAVVYEWIRR